MFQARCRQQAAVCFISLREIHRRIFSASVGRRRLRDRSEKVLQRQHLVRSSHEVAAQKAQSSCWSKQSLHRSCDKTVHISHVSQKLLLLHLLYLS